MDAATTSQKLRFDDCPQCGETETIIQDKGPHKEMLCGQCKRHLRFVGKAELGLAPRSVSSTRNGIKPAQRSRVMQRDNFRCWSCGRASPSVMLHVGHVISVADGERMGLSQQQINDDENLVTQCEECNLGLGSNTMPIRFVVNVLLARIQNTNSNL
jgi:Zn finger protein HypA/HybF involved in hydrogenase expression